MAIGHLKVLVELGQGLGLAARVTLFHVPSISTTNMNYQ
jgi:hypothetical protein